MTRTRLWSGIKVERAWQQRADLIHRCDARGVQVSDPWLQRLRAAKKVDDLLRRQSSYFPVGFT